MPMHIGVGGVNKTVKDIYTGVGGVNKLTKEIWIGQGGVNKKAYTSGPPQLSVLSTSGGLNQAGWGITAGQYLWVRQQTSVGYTDDNYALYFQPNPFSLVGKSTMTVDWSATANSTFAYAFVINGTNVIYQNGVTNVARRTDSISLAGFQGSYLIYLWLGRWSSSTPSGGTMYIYSIKVDGVPIFTP